MTSITCCYLYVKDSCKKNHILFPGNKALIICFLNTVTYSVCGNTVSLNPEKCVVMIHCLTAQFNLARPTKTILPHINPPSLNNCLALHHLFELRRLCNSKICLIKFLFHMVQSGYNSIRGVQLKLSSDLSSTQHAAVDCTPGQGWNV